MSIQSNISADKKAVVIKVTQQFDFSLHQDFRNAYSKYLETGTIFTLDLSQTDYMDSSALGMILLLKEHADKISGQVIISKPNDSIVNILEIAQFHQLMTIER